VNENVDVELSVAPVDFQKRLESLEELLGFVVGAAENFLNLVGFVLVDGMLTNPGEGVEEEGIGLFPGAAHDVVPLLKCLRVVVEFTMLAPSLEALDRLETSGESALDEGSEIIFIG